MERIGYEEACRQWVECADRSTQKRNWIIQEPPEAEQDEEERDTLEIEGFIYGPAERPSFGVSLEIKLAWEKSSGLWILCIKDFEEVIGQPVKAYTKSHKQWSLHKPTTGVTKYAETLQETYKAANLEEVLTTCIDTIFPPNDSEIFKQEQQLEFWFSYMDHFCS